MPDQNSVRSSSKMKGPVRCIGPARRRLLRVDEAQSPGPCVFLTLAISYSEAATAQPSGGFELSAELFQAIPDP
ncbi:MAG: hypothetical protein NVS2B15_09930 [Pseudarthrobacter sp.]